MPEVLKDKNYKSYSYISRYTNVPYYFHTRDEKYIYGTSYQLRDDNNYVIHKVLPNETYDSISLNYYHTPLYYWVIMDFNHLQDPFDCPVEGTELKIPTLTNIVFEVNS